MPRTGQFITSLECRSRHHCRDCRDPGPTGQRFRDSFARLGEPVPEVCPYGIGTTTPVPLTVSAVAHGALALAKTVVGADRASDEVIAERQRTCGTCEHATVTAGVIHRCGLCGCLWRRKVLLASESCPAQKWGPSTPPSAPDAQGD